MKTWLFNPFKRIAGSQALYTGWFIMLVTALAAWQTGTHFDGVIDIHYGLRSPLWLHLAEPFIDWACAVLVFYIAGRILSRTSFRFIDVAGTLALARAPMLIATLGGLAPMPEISTEGGLPLNFSITPAVIMAALLAVVFGIWMIALMWKAFSISCNLKGTKAVVGFVLALIISEILSKVIFYPLYQFVHT